MITRLRVFLFSTLHGVLITAVSGLPQTAMAVSCGSVWYTTPSGISYTYQDRLQKFTSFRGKTYAISRGGLQKESVSPGIVAGSGSFYGLQQRISATYGGTAALPKVADGETQKLLRDVYGPVLEAGGAPGAYLGLINRNDGAGFVTMDGSGKPSYYNWQTGQPRQDVCTGFSGTTVPAPYVVMDREGRWRTGCDEALPALLEFGSVLDCAVPYAGSGGIAGTPEINLSPAAIEGLQQCNTADFEDFVLYRGTTYAISKAALEWGTAKLLSESSGGRLAEIPDADTNDFLARRFSPKFTKTEFRSDGSVRFDTGNAAWFGMYDPFGVRTFCESDRIEQCRLVPERFVWVSDASIPFRNWGTGEPNNFCWKSETCRGERWASLSADGSWRDQGDHLGDKALLKGIAAWPGLLKCTAPLPAEQPPENPVTPPAESPPPDAPLCADGTRSTLLACDETVPLASVAPATGCPAGYTLSADSSSCTTQSPCSGDACSVPPSRTCPAGTTLTAGACVSSMNYLCPLSRVQCAMATGQGTCPEGTMLNPVIQQCEKIPEGNCPSGYFWDRDADRCFSDALCPPGSSLNPVTDRCEAAAAVTCPDGYSYNTEEDTCSMPPVCEGGTYNAALDRCERTPSRSCPDPAYSWNLETGVCERAPSCPAGSYDAMRDRCVSDPLLSCASGSLDGSNCTWSAACSSESSYNPATSRCELAVCPDGYTYSATRSRCERPPACSQGTFNPATDRCEGATSYAATSSTIGTVSFGQQLKRTATNAEVIGAENTYGPPYRVVLGALAGTLPAGYASTTVFPGAVRLNRVQNPLDSSSCLPVTGSYEPEKLIGAAAAPSNCSGTSNIYYIYPAPPPTGSYIPYYGRTGSFILSGTTYTYPGASIQPQYAGQQPLGYAPATSGTKPGFTYYSCPAGGVLSGTQCSSPVFTAPVCSGSVFDAPNDVCHTPSGCTASLPYDPITGKCAAPPQCVGGTPAGGNCSAPASRTCPAGSYDATIDGCTAPASCPAGELDTGTDRCEAAATADCGGWSLDSASGLCFNPSRCAGEAASGGSCRGEVARTCAAPFILTDAVCAQPPSCPADPPFPLAQTIRYAADSDRCVADAQHICPAGTGYLGPPATACRAAPDCGDGTYVQCRACSQGAFNEAKKKCEWISSYPATAVPAGSIPFTQPIYHSTDSSKAPQYRIFGYSQSGMTRIGYLATTSCTGAVPLYPARINGTCLASNTAGTGSFAGLTAVENGCPVRGWASRVPLSSGTSIPLYARPDTITVNGTAHSYMGLSTRQQYSAVEASSQSQGQLPTAYVPAASGIQASDTRYSCPNGGTVSGTTCIVSSSSDPVCPAGTSGCFMADQCPAGDFPCYQLKGETEMVLPGVHRTFCSPNACQTSMEAFVSDDDTGTGVDDVLDDGERDDEGNCLGTIYLFNGKDMRCREVDRMGQINAFAKLAATIAVAATGLGASLATAIQGLGVGATTATAAANAAIAIATNIVVDAATGQLGQGTLMACAMAGAAAFATAFAKDFLSQVGNVSTSIDPGTGIKSTITVTAQGTGSIDLSGMELVMKNGGTAIYEGPITDITSTAAGEVGVKSTMVTVLTNSLTGSVTTTTATVVSTVASQNQLLLAQAQVFASQWGPVMNQGVLGNYQATKCCYPDKMSGGCTPKEFQEAKMQHDGWCHVVGSYCSKSLLGLCLTRKETSCCFNSMLARVFHEQGRPQLKSFDGWGSAKKPVCRGFLPEEFQALDFGQMDLSEYVEDVTSKMEALHGDVEKYMKGTQQEVETRVKSASSQQEE